MVNQDKHKTQKMALFDRKETGYTKPNLVFKDPKTNGAIFLSNLKIANDKALLQSYNISHILTVMDEQVPPHSNDPEFTTLCIKIRDQADVQISFYFPLIIKTINAALFAGKNILVHWYGFDFFFFGTFFVNNSKTFLYTCMQSCWLQ